MILSIKSRKTGICKQKRSGRTHIRKYPAESKYQLYFLNYSCSLNPGITSLHLLIPMIFFANSVYFSDLFVSIYLNTL